MTEAIEDEASRSAEGEPTRVAPSGRDRGKTVHGEAANAGHRVLAPDDAEVEAYLETALKAPAPTVRRPTPGRRPRRPRHRRRPRFRQPVRPADRAAGPRARRLLGAPAARHPVRRARTSRCPGDHPVGQPDLGLRRRCAPRPDPAIWSGRIPVLGICYGAQLMAHELGGDVIPSDQREYGPANVSITAGRPACSTGIEREQPVWMSHGDSITRLPEGFRADRPDRLDPVRRPVDADREPVRHPVPSRGRPHAARPGRPAQLRGRHRRRRADLDRRPTSSTRPSPASANASTPMPARPGRTARSSAPCRAASTRPSRRRSSIARSATG